MAATKGIDVSMYQGDIDFKKVKAAGVKFVIIRCNNWDSSQNCVVKDPYFEQNYTRAKAAGLNVGVYYFTWRTTATGAKQDAELCAKFIKGKKFEYPIYFDLEWQKAFAKGKTVCSSMVTAFCEEMENRGYFAGLYISRSPLQMYISSDVAKKYALWIAEYGGKCNYSGAYGMWQYSSTGRVSGISGNVDMDYCYVDYPTIIKDGGFNGYKKAAPTTVRPAKILDSEGFKRGDKNLGVYALKRRLIALGHSGLDGTNGFGAGTEKAVNAVLKKAGYAQNGIAGEKFFDLVMSGKGVD